MFGLQEIVRATKARLIQGAKTPSLKIKGVSTDSRTIKLGDLFIAIKGPNFDGHNFILEVEKKGAVAVLIQSQNSIPPVKIPVILVKDTVAALGDIAKINRKKFNIPVVAVTGSNGKTTTKDMIACALSAEYKVLKNEGTKNNQIGLPQTLLGINPSYHFVVLELGTNHPGEIKNLAQICQPDIGVITNIGQAHLEFFRDCRGVFKEKSQLLENIRGNGFCLINADDKLLNKLSKDKKVVTFGIKEKCDFQAKGILKEANTVKFTVHRRTVTLNSLGIYNVYNALAAVAIARIFGVGYSSISQALADFRLPSMRMEIYKLNGITLINDAYNANPTSLNTALEVLKEFKTRGRKILVMGEMLELGQRAKFFHRQIGKNIGAADIDLLIATGNLARLTADAACSQGMDKNCVHCCDNTQEAAEILNYTLMPEDVVLVKGSRLCRMENILQDLKAQIIS